MYLKSTLNLIFKYTIKTEMRVLILKLKEFCVIGVREDGEEPDVDGKNYFFTIMTICPPKGLRKGNILNRV
jgi:hypothetical protein